MCKHIPLLKIIETSFFTIIETLKSISFWKQTIFKWNIAVEKSNIEKKLNCSTKSKITKLPHAKENSKRTVPWQTAKSKTQTFKK